MPAPSISTPRSMVMSTSEVSPPEEYFRGVSTLCRRMLDDMSAVKESFGDSWDQLSYQQQCRVIDQAIVDEDTVRRYESGGATGPECEYFPKLKLPTGQKVVCDENLTRRGFFCSWRDEHSAPFSWHTRSQMDLTLDTPPDTPSHPTTPIEPPSTSVEGEGRVIPGGRAVYTARPISLPRPPRFRWHYDPPDVPPDPPNVVVAAPRSATLPVSLNQPPKKTSPVTKYMLIRGKGDENENGGLMAKIRGAVAALTATCLPLRAAAGPTSHLSVHNAPEGGGEPELRPLHVQAQAVKLSPCNSSDSKSDEKYHSQSKTGSLGPQKSCQTAITSITSDPSLSSYVCSLPNDEDDEPYTIVGNSNPVQLSPHGQLPTMYHTCTVNMTQASEALTIQTTMANHTHSFPDNNSYSVSHSSPVYKPPTDSLPTPLPTPTTGDPSNAVEKFSPVCRSTPASSKQPLSTPPRQILQQPDLITDVESRVTKVDAITARRSLFEERRMDSEEMNDALTTSIISTMSESAIPKTGFDFLDNW